MRVGTDTGGTFTDLVTADGRIAKVPSTPDDPGRAVRQAVEQAVGGAGGATVLAHGTTVATNALLERRGARVALMTTAGFADIIEIARQDRPSLYDLRARRPQPLVPRAWRLEVDERLDATGAVLRPLDLDGLPIVPPEVEAVAVCLLHADLDAGHERLVAEALRAAGHDVTASHQVSPEFREYERTATTVINAYLRPPCREYLGRLADAADEVVVMTSAGGLVPVVEAAETPAALLLSGPAGGVAAGAAAAVANGYSDAITFDMGGTSTDVCLVQGGRPEPAGERSVGGLPVRLPSLDVHTIGAGGGSIAVLDLGGALRVGPRSAGAVPGPACYGRGGVEPTVTDADLVAGRIPAAAAFPGLGRLDLEAAQAALAGLGVGTAEEAAAGVLTVVDASMEQALRAVSVERGVDPRGLALVAFGGAGPLHACALAEALDMPAVIVPARAGVLSAVGILGAPRQVDLVRSWATPVDHGGLVDALAELGDTAAREAGPGAEVETAVDCRYAGQSHEITVASVEAFAAAHQQRNGYARPGSPVEVVALRATARVAAPLDLADLPAPDRDGAVGPAVIAEPDCTIWVPDGWVAEPGAAGALILTRVGTAHPNPDLADGGVAGERENPPERGETDLADGGVAGGRENPPERGGGREGLDPAALQVLIARLTGVAEEMGAVLRRAAFSPNIKERADCSAALFTPEGELLVQAEHIPVHLGSMPASVAAAIAAFGDDVQDGDQVILNDPFAGGTHLNDVTLVAPCVVDGRLIGWAANRAHHADLGGAAPGSIPADATEIQQEGLRIPPVRLTPEVRALVVVSSRTPVEREGDLDAQIGANRLGVERLATFSGAPLPEVIAYGERRMRATLADLPDGTWAFADVLDSCGPRPEQQQPAHIRLAVTVAGEEVTFDFTGTDDQRVGNVNAVEAVAVSCVSFALRAAADPTLPANGGAMRPVHVVAPAGSIVAALPPAAVGAGNVEVSQRIADVCLGALAQLRPSEAQAASQGTMNNLLIGGRGGGGRGGAGGSTWVYYETTAGGQGGGPDSAGGSGVQTGMTNTRNTPVEALERSFPMRVHRVALRRGSGGVGRLAGGDGVERDLEVLVPATVSLITERRVSRPWGLFGGGPGAAGENWLLPGGEEGAEIRLPDKVTLGVAAGDVIRVRTPGGGGCGSGGVIDDDTVRALRDADQR
jgi:5-oxoprolinase (ATP-hydrolysing)